MLKLVYKCHSCGEWSRRDCKVLTDGQAICGTCGAMMGKGYKDIEPIVSVEAQNFIILQAAQVKEVEYRRQKRKVKKVI